MSRILNRFHAPERSWFAKSVLAGFMAFVLASGLAVAAEKGTGLELPKPDMVGVVVEKLSPDAASIGLTSSRVKDRVELRLRQVGMTPSSEVDEYLYVNINVKGQAFSIELSLDRPVLYSGTQDTVFRKWGSTWDTGGVGIHGGDAFYVINTLDGLLDEFLNAYLKANPRAPRPR